MSDNASTIVFCNCGHSQIISDAIKAGVLRAIEESGAKVEVVQDLCGLAADKSPLLQQWASADELKIIACFPRAVKWLFNAGGYPLPESGVELFNMRADGAEDIISSVLDNMMSTGTAAEIEVTEKGDWVPWFPVIDYDRCSNCRQCMSFCLFGVYGVSQEGQVEVQKPANCKTNCPACARICPTEAIIFPKHESAPINGAEPGVLAQGEKNTLDVEELIKSDVYKLLRQRSGGHGGNAISAEDIQKALKERQGCHSEEIDDLVVADALSACGGSCDCDCDCESETETESECACSAADNTADQATSEIRACPCDCACQKDDQEKRDLE